MKFENYDLLSKYLKTFSLDSFNDKDEVKRYLEIFELCNICKILDVDNATNQSEELKRAVSSNEAKPYEPKFHDLCRLHWLALSRKVINVLELGSGFSTVVFADAAKKLANFFRNWVEANIRAERPFHVYSVEEEQRFLEITKVRLSQDLESFATLSRSSVEITLFEGRIASVYSKLPNISPDLIYLDGPSQFATTQEMNGFSFDSIYRMPMSADFLRLEFFLEPGTLIVVDGRTQNARFLKAFFKRNWHYFHDEKGDVHYFELQEKPLGRFNQKKLEFCLEGKWLLG
jgi:hypothetical protein